ncbi:MAG: hypothetical protein ACR2PG_05385 [Hyphomicrobiaceae bacterium]
MTTMIFVSAVNRPTTLINVDGVKIYMDGVPGDGEGGAPMIDAYATAPTFGRPSIDEPTARGCCASMPKASSHGACHLQPLGPALPQRGGSGETYQR